MNNAQNHSEYIGGALWLGKIDQRIDIRYLNQDPSIDSSLIFLHKTPWARTKVEEL